MSQQVDQMLKKFLEDDHKRLKDPMFGNRAAESSLMELCEFLKRNSTKLDDDVKNRAVDAIRKINLQPYRSYCREHLLDIGITNI